VIVELDVVNMEKINIIARNVELEFANMVNGNVDVIYAIHKNANVTPVQKLMRKFNRPSDHEFQIVKFI
jgi:hypothetical protein